MRTYATDILPRALVGEGIDPYYVGFNSSTALLRRLFVAEPELNPLIIGNKDQGVVAVDALIVRA